MGSTRALFFRGGCVGSPPELVPSPAPGAARAEHLRCNYVSGFTPRRRLCVSDAYSCLFFSFAACADEAPDQRRRHVCVFAITAKQNRCTYSSVCSFWFSYKRQKNVLKQNWNDWHERKKKKKTSNFTKDEVPTLINGHWQHSNHVCWSKDLFTCLILAYCDK